MDPDQLFRRVALRLWKNRALTWAFRAVSVVMAAALILVLGARLLGWDGSSALWIAAAALPVGCVVGLLARKTGRTEAARAVDTQSGGCDLFLTVAGFSTTPVSGNFSPLVTQQAYMKASELNVVSLVPWTWGKFTLMPLGITIFFGAVWLWLPQFDPFQSKQAREEAVQIEQWSQNASQLTKKRAQDLAKEKAAVVSRAVIPVESLLDTLKATRANQPVANNEFKMRRQELGSTWKHIQDQKLAEGWRDQAEQGFGAEADPSVQKIADALKSGDIDAVKKEMQKLAAEAAEAAKGGDKEKARKLAEKIKATADALQRELGGEPLDQAMRRAADQANMAGQSGDDGWQAAAESLNVAGEELERLREMLKDEKLLKQALDALEKARQHAQNGNGKGKPSGDGGEQSKSLEERLKEYQDFYDKQMAEGTGQGTAPGPGMKGPGVGEGGVAEEAEVGELNFTSEKATSPLVAGKTLLDWKTRGVGQSGDKTVAAESINQLQESVSEAIVKERVPAGYHQGIGKYFESLKAEEPSNK